jgi:hypothetical protein
VGKTFHISHPLQRPTLRDLPLVKANSIVYNGLRAIGVSDPIAHTVV